MTNTASNFDEGIIVFKVVDEAGEKRHVFRYRDMGPRDDMAIRSVTEGRLAVSTTLAAFNTGATMDLTAILLWRARVHAGETGLTFDDVIDGITYGSDIDIVLPEVEADEDADPNQTGGH